MLGLLSAGLRPAIFENTLMRTGRFRTSTMPKLGEDASLIAIPSVEGGEDVTYYYIADEGEAVASAAEIVKGARSLAGAWSDLDWAEFEESLDRIRHRNIHCT